MFRILIYLLITAFIAGGLAWLIDQPGSIIINFAGYEIIFSPIHFLIVAFMTVGTITLLWIALYKTISLPGRFSQFFKDRSQKRGLAALSSGLMAVGIGDRYGAARHALQAKKSLPHEPLTSFLRAQTAQLTGDHGTAKRIYQAMLASSDTELLGLRGLYLDAEQGNQPREAFQFANQAITLNPTLSWPVTAVFEFQCKTGDWHGALKTLDIAKTHKHINTIQAKRKRAVLLTALAKDMTETSETEHLDQALGCALEAHKLAPDLIPAATIAGNLLASKGNISRASKILTKTWKLAPHPDLARSFAFVRPGDAPKDRLQRVKTLAKSTLKSQEGAIAIALAAIEARDWEEARAQLEPYIAKAPTARICALMAKIEGEQFGNKGRVREWLARALRAPKDPVWIADGYISKQWYPTSPVTGALDRFVWAVPPEDQNEALDTAQNTIITQEDVSTFEHMTNDLLEQTSQDKSKENDPPEQQKPDEIFAKPLPEKIISAATDVNSQKKEEIQAQKKAGTEKPKQEIKPETKALPPHKADQTERAKTPIKHEKTQKTEKPAPTKISKPTNTKKNDENVKKDKKENTLKDQKTKSAQLPRYVTARKTATPETSKQENFNIFVPSHAPDDPGPEPADPEEELSTVERLQNKL